MQNDLDMPIRSKILDEAKKIINGSRQEEYGSAEDSFSSIAGLWSEYLCEDVTAHDVAMLMILLKVARAKGGKKTDNYVDICGYSALAGEMI